MFRLVDIPSRVLTLLGQAPAALLYNAYVLDALSGVRYRSTAERGRNLGMSSARVSQGTAMLKEWGLLQQEKHGYPEMWITPCSLAFLRKAVGAALQLPVDAGDESARYGALVRTTDLGTGMYPVPIFEPVVDITNTGYIALDMAPATFAHDPRFLDDYFPGIADLTLFTGSTRASQPYESGAVVVQTIQAAGSKRALAKRYETVPTASNGFYFWAKDKLPLDTAWYPQIGEILNEWNRVSGHSTRMNHEVYVPARRLLVEESYPIGKILSALKYGAKQKWFHTKGLAFFLARVSNIEEALRELGKHDPLQRQDTSQYFDENPANDKPVPQEAYTQEEADRILFGE